MTVQDWFEKRKEAQIKRRELEARAEVEQNPDLWVKCVHCDAQLLKEDLAKNEMVCPVCDYHFRINARTRIRQLFDENSFEEMFKDYDISILSDSSMTKNELISVLEQIYPKEKQAKYGVVPLENNTNGMVGESIDNLAKSEFKIIAEVILPIHHSFISACEHLSQVRKIFSKDIAFGQCQHFLNAHNLHHVEQIPTDSTAKAVQLAKTTPESAAIGSKIAGKIYNLPIMFEYIEDSKNNKTRFVIMSDFSNAPSGRDKTSLFVNLKNKDQVGNLFRLLGDFEAENINLTKIDSRPIHKSDDFRIGFFIDCQGHYLDESLQRLFAKRNKEIKWLGSYLMTNIKEKG